MTGRATRTTDDSGTVVPLIVIFSMVASLLLLAVIDVTELFMKSRGVATVADGAALAAAQEIDKNTLYHSGGIQGADLPILTALAQQAVDTYVADNDVPGRFPGFQSATAAVGQANTVTVTVHATVSLPFVSWFTTDNNRAVATHGIGITQAASAVLRCGDQPVATCG